MSRYHFRNEISGHMGIYGYFLISYRSSIINLIMTLPGQGGNCKKFSHRALYILYYSQCS